MDGEKGGCAAVSAGRGTKTKVRMRLEYQGKYRDIHICKSSPYHKSRCATGLYDRHERDFTVWAESEALAVAFILEFRVKLLCKFWFTLYVFQNLVNQKLNFFLSPSPLAIIWPFT